MKLKDYVKKCQNYYEHQQQKQQLPKQNLFEKQQQQFLKY